MRDGNAINISTPIVEPNCVQEIYVDGIASLVRVGGCTKVILYSEHPLMDGATVHLVSARITIPTMNIPACMRQVAVYLRQTVRQYVAGAISGAVRKH